MHTPSLQAYQPRRIHTPPLNAHQPRWKHTPPLHAHQLRWMHTPPLHVYQPYSIYEEPPDDAYLLEREYYNTANNNNARDREKHKMTETQRNKKEDSK